MKPDLEEVEGIARSAGAILRAAFGDCHRIEYKGEIDPVTEVDRRSEMALVEAIQSRYPDHRIVTEESGPVGDNPMCGGASAWYLDPLDGTVNYAHGVPIYCVSVAFAEGGRIRLGAVYDPERDEMFSAERGVGAWLNGKPLHVSEASSLNHSLLVTGFSYDIRTIADNNLDNYARFALRTHGVRRLGAAALDLCYVAAGRFDGYWELTTFIWDVAAGGLIAEEAGATVTTAEGRADYMQKQGSILAANPQLHGVMLETLLEN